MSKKEQNKTCPYSESCFTCPLPDCNVDQNAARSYNRLETDGRNLVQDVYREKRVRKKHGDLTNDR